MKKKKNTVKPIHAFDQDEQKKNKLHEINEHVEEPCFFPREKRSEYVISLCYEFKKKKK